MDAVIFSAVAFVSTMTGGLAAAKLRSRFGALAAFVAGVLIAVPLFDLLPEALTLGIQADIPPRHVMYVVAAGFLFVAPPQWYLAYLLPFFAGGFLYLGASDLLPEAHEKNPPLVSLLSTLAGFLLIFAVVQVL